MENEVKVWNQKFGHCLRRHEAPVGGKFLTTIVGSAVFFMNLNITTALNQWPHYTSSLAGLGDYAGSIAASIVAQHSDQLATIPHPVVLVF
jgi:hypothetical protein